MSTHAPDRKPLSMLIAAAALATILFGAFDAAVIIRATVRSGNVPTGDRWLVGLLAPVNVGLIGLWGAGILHTRRWRGPAVAGGATIVRRGDRLHVALPRYDTAHLAWGMAMWAAIGGMIVIGAGVGRNPIAAVGWVFVAAAVAAIVTFGWRLASVRAGRWLVIDLVTRELRLPKTFGRAGRVVVPFDEVWAIESRSEHLSETFAPTIVWGRGDDARHERIAQWTDEFRAEALVRWLQEQMGPAGGPDPND